MPIPDAVDFCARREHDGGSHDGPCQRAHAHFIDSGNMNDAGLPKHALEMQHGIQTLALSRLVFEPFGQCLVELSRTRARISLQPPKDLR